MPDGELMAYARGEMQVPRHDRPVTRQARRIHDEVRLAAFKAEGAIALAGSIAEGMVGLVDHGRKLAKDDPEKQLMVSEIVNQALGTCIGIQYNLYRSWQL